MYIVIMDIVVNQESFLGIIKKADGPLMTITAIRSFLENHKFTKSETCPYKLPKLDRVNRFRLFLV